MNKKGLIGKLKRGIYVPIIATAVGIGSLIGCDKNPIEPKPNQKPVASFTVTPLIGDAPLTVNANGNTSYDSDGSVSTWFWDYENNGVVDDSTSGAQINPIYNNPGNYSLSLFVRDNEGAISPKKLENIVVTQVPANNPPQTTLNVDSTSGAAPLEVRIQGGCTDPDGQNEIVDYRVMKGNNILTTTNPTDTTITLNEGTYSFYSKCRDGMGNEATSDTSYVEVSPPPQPDFLDISGKLEAVGDTGIGTPGEGAVYTFSPDTSNISFLGNFTADANGKFSFRSNAPVQGDSVYLQARQNSGTPDSNFVRTIVLPNRDTTGLLVRANLYNPTLGISRDSLRAHLQEINGGFDKWNLDSLRGVEIVADNPGKGNFTLAEQDSIESTFRQNLSCYTGGRLNNIIFQRDPSFVDRGRNWIYIFPDNTINAGGITGPSIDENGVIYNALTRMKYVSQLVTSHEQGHVFIAPHNHASTLQSPKTIMGDSLYVSVEPGPADCEAGRIIYEDTFKPRESYERTLGLRFWR
ncbi:MAG: PKD domain-containing protein [Nanoarchaeota archaeon]|nr:PKD domain-containing protein [Nanoarchaeota archaeon]